MHMPCTCHARTALVLIDRQEHRLDHRRQVKPRARRAPLRKVLGLAIVAGLVFVPLFEMLLELGDGNGTAAVLVVPAGPQAVEACVRVVVALRVRRCVCGGGGGGAAAATAAVAARGCAAARLRGGCVGAASRWVCWHGGVAAWQCGGAVVRRRTLRRGQTESGPPSSSTCAPAATPLVSVRLVWYGATASGVGIGRRLTLRYSASASAHRPRAGALASPPPT